MAKLTVKVPIRFSEKAQKDLYEMCMAYKELAEMRGANNEKLESENAKLRELVEDMLSCIEIRAAFNRPPTTDMYEQFAKRASELGIEVDE